MTPRSTVREDLLAAAERLFAASGLDGVSLREITAEAGATNASAAHPTSHSDARCEHRTYSYNHRCCLSHGFHYLSGSHDCA